MHHKPHHAYSATSRSSCTGGGLSTARQYVSKHSSKAVGAEANAFARLHWHHSLAFHDHRDHLFRRDHALWKIHQYLNNRTQWTERTDDQGSASARGPGDPHGHSRARGPGARPCGENVHERYVGARVIYPDEVIGHHDDHDRDQTRSATMRTEACAPTR